MTIPAISPQTFLGDNFPGLGATTGTSGGLFGSFMSDFLGTLTQAVGQGETEIGTNADPLLALLGLDEGQSLADLPPELLDEEGEPDLNMIAKALFGDNLPEGDIQAISVTVIQVVTVVYSELNTLQSAGIPLDDLGSVDALAAAYMNQGYTEEEAFAKAESLVAIMNMLDAQIKRMKEMLAALTDENPLAGYINAAGMGTQQDMPFGFGHAQVSFAAFKSVSVTTTSYTDLSTRILNGAPLTGDVNPNRLLAEGISVAALAQSASADADFEVLAGQIAAQDGEVALNDEQLAQLVKSAERILEAVVKADKPAALQQAVAAAVAGQQAAKTQTPRTDAAIAATEAPVDADGNPVTLAGVDAALEAEAPQPGYRQDERAAPQRQGAAEGNIDFRADTAPRAPSLDAQTTPVDSANATPVYKVETSPTGGMQIVNAATGEVVNINNQPAADAARATPFDSRMADLIAQARVVEQMRVHVRTVANHGGGRIDVAINPPELGRVEVNLRIKEGKVSGTITVQRPEVMEHLARELKVLEQGLADAGLTLNTEGLTFQLQEQGAHDKQDSGNRQASAGGDFSGSGSGDQDAADNAAWINPDRLVDVNV